MNKQYRCQLIEISPSGEYYPVGGEIVFGSYHPIIRTPIPVTVTFHSCDGVYPPDPPTYHEWEYFADDNFGRLLYKRKELE